MFSLLNSNFHFMEKSKSVMTIRFLCHANPDLMIRTLQSTVLKSILVMVVGGGRRSRPQGHHMIIDESVHKGEYELTTREPEELPSLA